MPAGLHPYLNFDGSTREALEFYGAALGGTPSFSTYGEFGALPADHPDAGRVMHGALEVTDLIKVYSADILEGMSPGPFIVGTNVSLALMGDDEELLRGAFEKLAEGGEIGMPLQKQVWGDVYGQVRDRFGIEWQVNISTPAGEDDGPEAID
ncbi:VOC family protein [Brachybacterium sp. AOP25-B2-12]|uniref:VOC family protein n=1 Tax=Brachybacterium sp. AOP25-B2-12 TaxID=3457710 RepID=UPI004033C643